MKNKRTNFPVNVSASNYRRNLMETADLIAEQKKSEVTHKYDSLR